MFLVFQVPRHRAFCLVRPLKYSTVEKDRRSLLSEARSIKAIVLVMLAPRPVVPLD